MKQLFLVLLIGADDHRAAVQASLDQLHDGGQQAYPQIQLVKGVLLGQRRCPPLQGIVGLREFADPVDIRLPELPGDIVQKVGDRPPTHLRPHGLLGLDSPLAILADVDPLVDPFVDGYAPQRPQVFDQGLVRDVKHSVCLDG